MSQSTPPAWQQLLETGSLVLFRIVDTQTGLSPDKENVYVRADLVFQGDDEDTDSAKIVKWGGVRFPFYPGNALVPRCKTSRDFRSGLPYKGRLYRR